MSIEQDRTSVTVSQLDVTALGVVSTPGNDAMRFDQATQTDQPVGPFPDSPSSPAPEVDGSNGVK